MSFEKQPGDILLVIDPRPGDLGGFSVRRLLLAAGRQTRWSGRSSSSITWGRRLCAPGTASTCGRIRTSGWRP